MEELRVGPRCPQGKVSPSSILASAPSDKNLDAWRESGCRTTHCNLEVLQESTLVFLATKPHVLPDVLQEIRPAVGSHHIIVSLAASVTLQTLQRLLPAGTKVLRLMPNLPCVVQAGAMVFARGSSAGDGEAALLKCLLSSCGLCEEVPESYINIHTGLSGSGVAYVRTCAWWDPAHQQDRGHQQKSHLCGVGIWDPPRLSLFSPDTLLLQVYLFAEALAEGAVKMGMPGGLASRIAAQTLLVSQCCCLGTPGISSIASTNLVTMGSVVPGGMAE
ncbi:pyrroline-5-carboxylate reductase 3 isoform X1 [Cuculus canorus]|uniref:pyrroline-5-carboxylate reductase 3 isoform X1 n=1 Tax=Cuculus canorus TaxID=55661 RepID=UPI0023AA9014|nr:pyrroline-5-carboxylate reductase 3 isoform X1 [Cuculus canorus]